MNNIGNVNHILKKKNPTYFLSIKLNTLLAIKRCPESDSWSTTHFMAGEVTFSSIFRISTC